MIFNDLWPSNVSKHNGFFRLLEDEEFNSLNTRIFSHSFNFVIQRSIHSRKTFF